MITYLREKYMLFKFEVQGITKNPISIAKQLMKSQYWDRKKINKYQLDHLNKLTHEAIKNVKYYQKDEYKKINSFECLNSYSENIPVLTKSRIKESAKFLINSNNKNGFEHATSGSTGQPMKIKVYKLAEAYRIASKIRFYQWWGVNMFDRNVLIWKKAKRNKSVLYNFKKLELKLLGRLELSVFDLNDDTVYNYFKKIDNFKPKYIRGYKSGIFELARLMDKHDLQFENSQLKVVVVTSEILFENERSFIERVLQCPVANEYGGADGGLYANECPEGSLHINEESIYISTDMDQNAFVTEIFNRSMPLINYKNEDRLVFSDKSCSCGRNLKVIKEVKGRSSDYILCRDGKKTNSLVLGAIFTKIEKEHAQSIIQFRVIQNDYKLKIEIIPGINFVEEFFKEIEASIFRDISNSLEIEFQLVKKIQAEKSGKLRFFIRQS